MDEKIQKPSPAKYDRTRIEYRALYMYMHDCTKCLCTALVHNLKPSSSRKYTPTCSNISTFLSPHQTSQIATFWLGSSFIDRELISYASIHREVYMLAGHPGSYLLVCFMVYMCFVWGTWLVLGFFLFFRVNLF